MGLADEVVAALEAVRDKVGEAREEARAGAEKFGESYEHLSVVFAGSGNSSALASLSKMDAAAESLAEADTHAAAARDVLGEYVEVVKGNGSGGDGGAATSTGAAGSTSAEPTPTAPTPESPAPYYGGYFDALRSRTTDTDPTDGTLTTVDGTKIEEVTSGQRGPAAGGPGLRPPYSQMWTVLNHAEGHAAALMRTRELKHTTLYINNEPCSTPPYGCERVLPRIIPKGSTMTVYGPNGYARVYQGTGEGLTT